jgi:hypothetical protein
MNVTGYCSGKKALNPVKHTLPFFELWDNTNLFSNIRSKDNWGNFSEESVPRTSFCLPTFTNRQMLSFPLSFLASPRQACCIMIL